jgi:hypothetical protein
MSLSAPVNPHIGGGCALTCVATPYAAVAWSLSPGYGSLKWAATLADGAGRCVNYYSAPTDPGLAGATVTVTVRYA